MRAKVSLRVRGSRAAFARFHLALGDVDGGAEDDGGAQPDPGIEHLGKENDPGHRGRRHAQEVEGKVEAKVSEGVGENLGKCYFPWISGKSAFLGRASGVGGTASLTAAGPNRRD